MKMLRCSEVRICPKGQIIDIFSPIEDLPVRILFDIDKIESMNLFDENNQKNK